MVSFLISFLSSDLFCFFFFFNDTATTEIYTLSLHDALPILWTSPRTDPRRPGAEDEVALQGIVEQTVTGMGYELVEIERSAGGLLRVTIDWPWSAGSPRFVTVDDCEKVTRQLQFALEVDAVDYRRLEVSSPGIDRPLRDGRDFERFAGEVVDITLKTPIGAAPGGAERAPAIAANRK